MPSLAKASSLSGLALAMVGAVAFSGKAIIVKLAYRYGVDAVTLVMLRMLFALPLFSALAWWSGRGKPALSRRDKFTILALGFSGYYLASFLDFAGLAYISASLERLILYLNPTLVLGIGALFFKRKVNAGQLTSLGVSYCGVLLVFGREVHVVGAHVILGAALVFGSTVSYALYLIHSGEEVKRLGALRLAALASIVACLFCILQFLLMRPMSALHVAPQVIWLSVLNATACTFVPVLFVMIAIERIGSGPVAQASLIGPIATILMSVFILDEPFTPWIAAGTLLVLMGMGLLAKATRTTAISK